MAFSVGAIVGELQLKKDQWDASIKKVKDDQKSLDGLVVRNSQQFKKMGMAMTVAGGVIVGAVGLTVKAFADFDQSMTESLAIMGDVSDEMQEAMGDVAKTISEETVYSAKELAAAYFYLASAGMDAEQSMTVLGDVARFAQAGTFDLSTATDLLTDAQTALGLSSDDAIESQENLIRVSDVLVGANTLANASVKQFAEALTNKAAAALVNVNKEVEEGVAVLAAYADKGIKGTLAGQRLTMMMNGLFDATRRNKKAWEEAGISLFNADESMRSVADIVQSLEGYLGSMTVKQREAALAALGFNLRTKDSILTLMGSSEKIRIWTSDLKEMGGITREVSDKQLETFNNQMKILRNTITNAAIEIGETLTPSLMNLTKDLKDVIAGVSVWIKKHPELTGLITKSTLAVGGLLAVLGPFTMMLPGIVIGLTAVGVSLTAVAVGFGVLALVIGVAYAAYEGAIWIRDKWEGKVSAEQQAIYDTVEAWQNLSEAVGGFTNFLEAAEERELISAEKRREIWNKYKDDFIIGLKAISEGQEGPALKKLLKEIGDEHYYGAKAGGEQEKALDATAAAAAKLETELKEKLNKTLKETAKDTIGVVYETDKLFLSLEDIGGVIKELPPDMSTWGETSKDVFDKLIPGFDSVKTSIASVDNEFGLLPSSFFDSGKKILTTNEKIAAGLLETSEETTEGIGRHWENLGKNLGYSFGNFAENVLTKGTNLEDDLKSLFNDILTSFRGMIADMVTEWVTGFLKKLVSETASANVGGAVANEIAGGVSASGAATTAGKGWAAAFGGALLAFSPVVILPALAKFLDKIFPKYVPTAWQLMKQAQWAEHIQMLIDAGAVYDPKTGWFLAEPEEGEGAGEGMEEAEWVEGVTVPTTGFQHGGVVEAGPRQPTLFMFGEGTQRERAVISHVGGGIAGAGDITIRADFNVENLSVRSDEDIERIEEAFRRNVDGLSEKVAGHLRRFA